MRYDEWLRLTKRNRWDDEHLRSHIGKVGEVTSEFENGVRLQFRGCDIKDQHSNAYGCVHFVARSRCEG